MTNTLVDTPWDEPSGRSPEFAAYMAGDFQSDDPWNRIGGTELGESPLLCLMTLDANMHAGLILGMLTADPNRRLTLDQIFAHPWIQQYVPHDDVGRFIDPHFLQAEPSRAHGLRRHRRPADPEPTCGRRHGRRQPHVRTPHVSHVSILIMTTGTCRLTATATCTC
jgi:hypothetical protein